MWILAIDPGTTRSGFVITDSLLNILKSGKIENTSILFEIARVISERGDVWLPIEMMKHLGKNVSAGGATFETCVWIGRFKQFAIDSGLSEDRIKFIYRHEEKMNLCKTMKANDKSIRIALAERFAPGEPNFGKGTKGKPGFFYGVANDAWQAFAVAVTFYDKITRGE